MIVDGSGAMFEDRRKRTEKKIVGDDGKIINDRRKSKCQTSKKGKK